MELVIAIRCNVDDEEEALNIRTAIDTAMIPFEELEPKVTSQVRQQIDPIPDE